MAKIKERLTIEKKVTTIVSRHTFSTSKMQKRSSRRYIKTSYRIRKG